MARSPYCSMCGELKGPGCDSGGYCKQCKHKKRTEQRAKARAEKGWRPWGSGPNPNCTDCNSIKEDIQQTYCNACRSRRAKEKRRAEGIPEKVITGLCPCGAERGPNQPYFCLACKAEDSRKWRESQKLPAEELARIKAERKKMASFKKAARKFTDMLLRTGVLTRQPCEVCGTEEGVEAHHDDYTKPAEIKWFCRVHHLEYHECNKDLIREDYLL